MRKQDKKHQDQQIKQLFKWITLMKSAEWDQKYPKLYEDLLVRASIMVSKELKEYK